MSTSKTAVDTLLAWRKTGWRNVSRDKFMNFINESLASGNLTPSEYNYWLIQFNNFMSVNTSLDVQYTLSAWQKTRWANITREKYISFLDDALKSNAITESEYAYWLQQYDNNIIYIVETGGVLPGTMTLGTGMVTTVPGTTTTPTDSGGIANYPSSIIQSVLANSAITITQAQYLINELDKVINSANAVKDGSATVESLQLMIVQVLQEIMLARRDNEITTEQLTIMACSLNKLADALKVQYSNGSDDGTDNSEMNKLIALLFIAGPILIGLWAVKNKEGVATLLKMLETTLYVIIYLSGIVIIGGFVYWSVVSLIKNNWDVGKAIGSMTAVVVEEIIEGIFVALVDLVKALWNAVVPKLEDIAVSDSGGPEWYDFISPVLGIAYIVDVTTGKANNPFTTRTNNCLSVIQLRNLLAEIIKAKGGTVETLITTDVAPSMTTNYVIVGN